MSTQKTQGENFTPEKVAILGAGSFGSVLANIVAKNGHAVHLWIRNEEHLGEIEKERKNERYFPDFNFDTNVSFSNQLESVLINAYFIILAVPSHAFRSLLPQIKPFLKKDAIIISTAKGIEASTFKLMSEVVREELPVHRVAVLSGPNIALEIAQGELSGTVVASEDSDVNSIIQNLFASSSFRVYDNTDIYGVELAGALKNIYAIASGMSYALGMGYNARSMLLTRSLAEMSRFAVSKGANPMTFLGLAGVGDLFVTCTSPLSRNFRLGELIAKGKTAEQAITIIGSTVEGYSSVKTVSIEARELDIYMPLANALEKILYHEANIIDVVKELMLGDNNHDVEFLTSSDS